MATPSILVEGIDELIAKLNTLADLRPVTGALMAAGGHVAGRFKEYPGQTRLTRAAVYGETFASDRQRRFFFAAMRDGRIEVPYRRGSSPGSRNLKQSWTVAQVSPLAVEVGTNAPYAPYVHGAERQSKYMAALGWRTDREIIAAERETVVAYVQAAVRQAIEG